jgi:very-short-patch-repair endonuclease
MAKKFAVPLNTLIGKASIRVRKKGIGSPKPPPLMTIQGMNEPESIVYDALTKLKIKFESQKSSGGGATFGGAKLDFFLVDYNIDLEYNGPFHGTTEGKARDLLRTAALIGKGIRLVTIDQFDLPRIKSAILEKIGVPISRTPVTEAME